MTDTPRRLFDEAEGALRDAIDAAREDLPTDDQLDALAAKLGPLLGGGPGGGGGGGAAASTGLGGLKIAGGLVGVAAAAVVAVYVAREPAPDRTHAPPTVEIADASLAVDARVALASVVDAGVDASVEVAEPAPRRPRARDAPAPVEPPPELELLRRAQDALASSPDDALQIAGEHARAYPRGMLAQEREVIAIDALLRLGRRAEAEARAGRFRERWPASAQLRRIETLLGGSAE